MEIEPNYWTTELSVNGYNDLIHYSEATRQLNIKHSFGSIEGYGRFSESRKSIVFEKEQFDQITL